MTAFSARNDLKNKLVCSILQIKADCNEKYPDQYQTTCCKCGFAVAENIGQVQDCSMSVIS